MAFENTKAGRTSLVLAPVIRYIEVNEPIAIRENAKGMNCMQVEQSNLWENVNRNVTQDMGKGIAAYQANIPEETSLPGQKKEVYEHLCGVSESGSIAMTDAIYEAPGREAKTATETLEQRQGDSAQSRSNEVAIIANTTSAEDLKELEESGFSLMDTDSRTIITVTDKIKATLARAGVDISSFGEGLTKEQLEEITGSPAVAGQIAQILSGNDLPVTDQNLSDCIKALEQGASIQEMGEDSMVYLLRYGYEPTIRNIYTAEYSSGSLSKEEISLSEEDYNALKEQIKKVIEEAGLSVDDATVEDGKWLLEHGISLTVDNLVYFRDLKEFSRQLTEGTYDYRELVDSMAKAISAGKRPVEAEMITARRQREEIRLAMLTKAGRGMHSQGITVDTKPLEELVENLKEQEKLFYSNLLTAEHVPASKENVRLLGDTLRYFEEMKSQPAYVLGRVDKTVTVEILHEEGEQLGKKFLEANEKYEALWTAPRADLGDSIQKAFGNVDEILRELDLEPTSLNQRAVRILAYNSMPIDGEHIKEIKSMDEEMQRAFRNLTPATTVEMIRRGENPLDMTIEELNRVTEDIHRQLGNYEEERFTKYLWKLEQKKGISQEERSSYIGIYRLIAQVEKTDGAALGFLMKQGSDVTMRNLLTAVRSRKKGVMDYEIDDTFDGVDAKPASAKIDDMIEVGFQQNCLKDILDELTPDKLMSLNQKNWEEMTPEEMAQALREMEESSEELTADQSYRQEQLLAYRQVVSSSKDIYAYLERYDIPNSMANLMAASNLLRKPNQMMERLFRDELTQKDSFGLIADLKNQVLEDFGESLENPTELADAQEKLADVAEHALDGMLLENSSSTSLDVRMLRQLRNQLEICKKKAQDESYMVPIQTGDSVTGVSLKIVRGKEEKGWVDILFEHAKLGKVAASFKAKEQGITGMVAFSEESARQEIAEQMDLFSRALSTGKDESNAVDVKVAFVPDLSLEDYEMRGLMRDRRMEESNSIEKDKTNPVLTTRLYHIAETFIRSMGELLNPAS